MKDVNPSIYQDLYGWKESTILPIDVGQKSVVYAIYRLNGSPWYLVNVTGLRYPMFYPAAIFSIVDSRLSKYWIIHQSDEYSNSIKIGFKEMVEDEYFYGEYIEDDPVSSPKIRCMDK